MPPSPESRRIWILLAALAAAAPACGTAAQHYRNALTQQEGCCQALADPGARSACLGEVARTPDEGSEINGETFACVERHFQCDPGTGRASRASAQAQLDCLDDLASTQEARNEATARAQ